MQHYQILESVPPSGYNSSISAAYKHIVLTLEALCEQHGEENIFTGDPKLQVTASLPNGESANPVLSLANATWALLGVGDQGGGCPVEGEPWPEYVNISAGYLGGGLSHAARYLEVLEGRAFGPNDTVGPPTGPSIAVNWTDVRKFTPNPSVDDFLPEQCVAGGSWVLRNDTFFVAEMLSRYGRLSNSTTDTWQECANLCMAWTIDENSPLDPCAMWSWQDNATTATEEIPYHMCLLGQQWVAPDTKLVPGLVSGCQFGTVCNNSLPVHNGAARIVKQARPRIPGATPRRKLLFVLRVSLCRPSVCTRLVCLTLCFVCLKVLATQLTSWIVRAPLHRCRRPVEQLWCKAENLPAITLLFWWHCITFSTGSQIP